jgi:queuine/archaeosine tRNA-ribosyltransferase
MPAMGVSTKDGLKLTPFTPPGWLKFTYINTENFIRDPNPIEEGCDCPCCQITALATSTIFTKCAIHLIFAWPPCTTYAS